MEQVSKELHRPTIKKYPRRHVEVQRIDEIFGADLVDMSFSKDENKPYKFLFTCIDCFSKYAWAIPLKGKSADDVVDAFEEVFKERIPEFLWVDEGKEFYNNKLKALLKKHNIQMYSTHGDHKSAVVERFNRTLKTNMWREFTKVDNRKWVAMLPDLVEKYNNTVHRTIKMTPVKASRKENEDEVFLNLSNHKPISKAKPKLKLGDLVRVSTKKGVFEKSYIPNWTREVFRVKEIQDTTPITYKLTEYDGTPIEGSFYEQELQYTDTKLIFQIDAIMKTRTRKGEKEHFIHWYGWPKKYDSWISDEELKLLS